MDDLTQSTEYDTEEFYGGFDPYEFNESETLCPSCKQEYMREIPWAVSPDDYELGLKCGNCGYEERD